MEKYKLFLEDISWMNKTLIWSSRVWKISYLIALPLRSNNFWGTILALSNKGIYLFPLNTFHCVQFRGYCTPGPNSLVNAWSYSTTWCYFHNLNTNKYGKDKNVRSTRFWILGPNFQKETKQPKSPLTRQCSCLVFPPFAS